MTDLPRAEYCRAALARALTWADDHPSDLPLLGTPEDAGLPTRTSRKDRCKRGHEHPERYADGRCIPCRRERGRG